VVYPEFSVLPTRHPANTLMPNLVQGHEYFFLISHLPIHKVVIIYLLVVALSLDR
jgi:hypothetical protein